MIANMFLHLSFDRWMRENFTDVPFERYADDIVVHCRSKVEAERMRNKIEERLLRCGLQLHPEKTRIVCCRPGAAGEEDKSFDFLGFTFQPRVARSKTGQIFVTFSPAISGKAAKRIRATMRRKWHVPRCTKMSLNELAQEGGAFEIRPRRPDGLLHGHELPLQDARARLLGLVAQQAGAQPRSQGLSRWCCTHTHTHTERERESVCACGITMAVGLGAPGWGSCRGGGRSSRSSSA